MVVKSSEVVKNEVVKSEVVVKKENEMVVKSLQPDKEVVKNESLQPIILQPTEKVVKNQENILQPNLQPTDILQPETSLQFLKCSRCSELQTKIKELQQPINPTIELWKTRYFDLEKKTNEK